MIFSISKYAEVVKSAIIMVAGLTSFLFSSCSLIYTDQEDCDFGLHLRFKYDYNMSFGDAFPTQVSRVSVYVFDEEGKFVIHQLDEGVHLSEEGYRMKLELPDGKYRIICWGGSYDHSFVHHRLTDDCDPAVENLEAMMLRDQNNEWRSENGCPLNSIFWGELSSLEVKAKSIQYQTISLMKLTKQIKINLVNAEGESLESDNFNLYMDGCNGRLSADDASVLEDDMITFHPYYVAEKLTHDTNDIRYGITTEFSCPRIMKDDDSLRLHAIDVVSGKDVLDFSVAEVLSTYAPSAFETAGGIVHFSDPQEFLDRSDLYNLTFILQDGSWKGLEIQVLSWSVRIDNVNL